MHARVMFAPPRPKAESKPQADKLAARAERRQELARIIEAKQQQRQHLAGVRPEQSVGLAMVSEEGERQRASVPAVPSDCTASPDIRPCVGSPQPGSARDCAGNPQPRLASPQPRSARDCAGSPQLRSARNKENQLPRPRELSKGKGVVPPLKLGAAARPPMSNYQPPKPGSLQAAWMDWKSGQASKDSARKELFSKDLASGSPVQEADDEMKKTSASQSKDTEDAVGIEEMYNFDLVKVEEMVKQEASSSMEEMYCFDLAKVPKACNEKLPSEVQASELPKVAADACQAASAIDLPKRSRRRSAPGPGESQHMMPKEELWQGPPKPTWQDAGLRQLAAENRELKQRMAQLESDYQRPQQLAISAQSAVVEDVTADSPGGFAEMD